MDKQTLNNYGWVIITVLVLAVMIALATPFGNYIKEGAKSTLTGLFESSENALNTGLKESGVTVDKAEFDNVPTVNKNDNLTIKDPALNPDDGTTPQNGDTYSYGDYTYRYASSEERWLVRVKNYNQTEYGAILESINGKNVTSLSDTFMGCLSLVKTPIIPNNITNMRFAFAGCTSLTTVSAIPNDVTDMYSTFNGCTSLTGTITINANPTDYDNCFYDVDFQKQQITLTGSSNLLDKIGKTCGNNSYCNDCNGYCTCGKIKVCDLCDNYTDVSIYCEFHR